MFALSAKNYRCYKSIVFLQLILKLMLFLFIILFFGKVSKQLLH